MTSAEVDSKLASPCGAYCGECNCYNNRCAGCGYVNGKPFWGECPVYDCAAKRCAEHCGLCKEFPCEQFLSTFDPAEGPWRSIYRAGQLVYRKKIGTKAWIEGKASGKNADPKYKK